MLSEEEIRGLYNQCEGKLGAFARAIERYKERILDLRRRGPVGQTVAGWLEELIVAVESLTAERDALKARVAELERDAGRYQWLRDASLDHRIDPPVATLIPSRGIKVSIQYPGYGKCIPECLLSGVSLDAAIDAAREVKP